MREGGAPGWQQRAHSSFRKGLLVVEVQYLPHGRPRRRMPAVALQGGL